jgi:hypothetical protein
MRSEEEVKHDTYWVGSEYASSAGHYISTEVAAGTYWRQEEVCIPWRIENSLVLCRTRTP